MIWLALAVALLALVLVLAHVAIPTPPAHTWDPFGLARPMAWQELPDAEVP